MNDSSNNKIKLTTLFTVAFILFGTLFFACTRAPEYPIEPMIAFKNFNRNNIVQNANLTTDYLELVLTFTDGDGDLGTTADGQSPEVVILDMRDSSKNFLRIPYVSPQGTGNGINGEMTLRIPPTCCIFPDGAIPCKPNLDFPTDTVNYKVWIFDRAGHKSNVLLLPSIYIDCTK